MSQMIDPYFREKIIIVNILNFTLGELFRGFFCVDGGEVKITPCVKRVRVINVLKYKPIYIFTNTTLQRLL